MRTDTPQAIYLKDYRPPPYRVEQADLRVELGEEGTLVTAELTVAANPGTAPGTPLALDGEGLETLELALDERRLEPEAYRIDDDRLIIGSVPERFRLRTRVRIHPETNTALEGLYRSADNFCTQCEAEGFRRITWYLDRPDNMARFSTTIVADRERYPVLLSNGNLIERGELPGGRHLARWQDPFPKPSYLFALVAGRLEHVEDRFVTASGREVTLRIYTEAHNIGKCDHAMASLKRAMRWDEEVFGLEYDLDLYMIVAVDDFNMGAMENKGLNLFNSKYILASPETATDADYEGIEGVVAHEYFHNWTGNRVTCRDWFQLSLKEGLTVFRDQEFSADMTSRPVKRIGEVRVLRTAQFAEDAGPMAHPVRPQSYMEINNFYTVTVYNKGAEVVRMIHTLLGPRGFRAGMDRYFERHDGQAVTTDDFVAAMQDAGGVDLTQFKRWYDQAGTPRVAFTTEHDPATGRLRLTLSQRTPPTPGEPEKAPLHIPVRIGLLDPAGVEIPLRLEGEDPGAPAPTERVLDLTGDRQEFVFVDVTGPPVASLLRDFSAPVILEQGHDDAALAFLLAHDRDPFNRWDAGQQLALRVLHRMLSERAAGREPAPDRALIEGLGRTLQDGDLDPALIAQAVQLPSEKYVAETVEEIDAEAIHAVREALRREIGRSLAPAWRATYRRLADGGPYGYSAEAAGRRALRNACLAHLAAGGGREGVDLAFGQFRTADNMTDALAALAVLCDLDRPERGEALEAFYARWKGEPLVIDKWLAVQATSALPDTLERVRALLEHPAFYRRNPNRVRALVGAFAHGNPVRFHGRDGAGYRFVADRVLELDGLNPQVAARLASAFASWRRHEPVRRGLMRGQLERMAAHPGLSRDVYELVSKSLKAAEG